MNTKLWVWIAKAHEVLGLLSQALQEDEQRAETMDIRPYREPCIPPKCVPGSGIKLRDQEQVREYWENWL